MKKEVKIVIDQYHQRILEESELMKSLAMEDGMKRRDEFLLSVGEETAVFLNTLIKATKPKIILELGTSYGYSTIWLAEAAVNYGGKIITLEIDENKSSYTKQKLKETGLESNVEFVVGDAITFLKKTNYSFDFVLVDIWKELYRPCFELFYPKLNDQAWVISDNMIFPPHSKPEMDAYQKLLRETGSFDSILMPIGSGIEVSQFLSK